MRCQCRSSLVVTIDKYIIMRDLSNIAEQLFNEIRGRFPRVTIGDAEGNITNEPRLARFFDFDFDSNSNTLGSVSVSLDERSGVTIMYGDNVLENSLETEKTDWYNFLKQMRTFSKKRLMNFEVRDINKSNLTKRDYSYLAKNRLEDNTMAESKSMYGTHKTSYQKIGNARLAIKHSGNIAEGESRTKKIASLYIENKGGERFKYPFKHLSGARAMTKHVSEGGHPYDDFGKYISGLSEELSNLNKFKKYMSRSSVMAESLSEHMDIVKERVTHVKKEIANLQKESYYKTAVEEYVHIENEEVPEDVSANWIDQLTVKQFNEDLKDVFPYIYNLVSEATSADVLDFEDIVSESPDTDQAVKQAMVGQVYPNENQAMIVAAQIKEKFGEEWFPMQTKGGYELHQDTGGRYDNPEKWFNPRAGHQDQMDVGEQVDAAFDKLLGQFADNFSAQIEGDEETDEGNAYAHAVRKAKMNGAEKGDEIDHPDDDEDKIVLASEEQKTPLGEFILSYYDRQQGVFPKGETAILTMVEKDYGDRYIKPASQFIERLGQVYEKYQMNKQTHQIEDKEDFNRMRELAGLG